MRFEARVLGQALALGMVAGAVLFAACEREQKALEQDLAASRAAKARADAQQIAVAVPLYQATFGTLPTSLEAVTRAQTVGGVTGGPFLAAIPPPPAGWSPYLYSRQGGQGFTVSSMSGGVTITAP